jgi:uncharacterized protein YqfB (UPF0267 family)
LEGIYNCLKRYGLSFFDDTEITSINASSKHINNSKIPQKMKKWLDIGIYNDGRNIRCLYSTKKASPNRPFIIQNRAVSKEDLKDSFIFVPKFWLENSKLFTVDIKKGSESIDDLEKKIPDYWFLHNVDIINMTFLKVGKSDSLESIRDTMTICDILPGIIRDFLMFYDTETSYPKKKKIYCVVNEETKKEAQRIKSLRDDDIFFNENGISKVEYLAFLEKESIKSLKILFISRNKYCFIKGDKHENNNVYYMVDLYNMKWWQGCYDDLCISKTMMIDKNNKGKSQQFDLKTQNIKEIEDCKKYFTNQIIYEHQPIDNSEISDSHNSSDSMQLQNHQNVIDNISDYNNEKDEDAFNKDLESIFG